MGLDYRDARNRWGERVRDALYALLKALLAALAVAAALVWVAIGVGVVRVLWGLW